MGEAGCQGRQWGSLTTPEFKQPCIARTSLDVFAGPCRCLRAPTYRRALLGSWDVDLQDIIFGSFCWILQHLPRQDGFQPPSCSAFPHAALLMARAHSGAHIFGTKENPSHCPLFLAYSMTLIYSLLHSRSFRPRVPAALLPAYVHIAEGQHCSRQSHGVTALPMGDLA